MSDFQKLKESLEENYKELESQYLFITSLNIEQFKKALILHQRTAILGTLNFLIELPSSATEQNDTVNFEEGYNANKELLDADEHLIDDLISNSNDGYANIKISKELEDFIIPHLRKYHHIIKEIKNFKTADDDQVCIDFLIAFPKTEENLIQPSEGIQIYNPENMELIFQDTSLYDQEDLDAQEIIWNSLATSPEYEVNDELSDDAPAVENNILVLDSLQSLNNKAPLGLSC